MFNANMQKVHSQRAAPVYECTPFLAQRGFVAAARYKFLGYSDA